MVTEPESLWFDEPLAGLADTEHERTGILLVEQQVDPDTTDG